MAIAKTGDIMRIVIALAICAWFIWSHEDRQEIKAQMRNESTCFELAKTRGEVDDCYAYMRNNIERRPDY